MIFVALGSNLPGIAGSPRHMVAAALEVLPDYGMRVRACSPWYRSAPVPPSDQPWFVNGVARVEAETTDPAECLARLHAIEARFGRHRDGTLNAARPLDLDLLDFEGMVRADGPSLPHPRMTHRAFVLRPLADIAPTWRHPATGQDIASLLSVLAAAARDLERIDET